MASATVARIPELLHHIFEFSDHQSLTCLVRVSSGFHHISVAHLWSAKDLIDLLGLLPEDILGPTHSWRKKRALKKAPQDSDWGRVHHYSVYTTSLVVCTGDCPEPLVTFLADRSHFFFPRLRDLCINATSRQYQAAECVPLGGKGLQRLEVNGSDGFGNRMLPFDINLTESFFRNIMTYIPNLTQLKIDCFLGQAYTHLVSIQDTFCLALSSLARLEKLHWHLKCTLPQPVLAAIAAHPSISDLDLEHLDSWPVMDSNTLFFPSLKAVRLLCRREAGDAFVRTIGYPHLLSALDMVFTHIDIDPPLAFFQPFSHLFHLSLNLTSVRLFPGDTLSWAQLRPLLNCQLLVLLVVSQEFPIAGFNDEAVKELASSLSKLQDLHFWSTSRDVSLIGVTLFGLMPFAQLTTHLQSLTITVTTRVPDTGMTDALLRFQPTSPHPLHELDLCTTEINIDDDTPDFFGARRTAGIITLLWPLLRSYRIRYSEGVHNGQYRSMRSTWDEVNRHMEQREQDGRPISFI